MILDYYTVRYANSSLYTFEFIFVVILFVFVLYLNRRDIDKNSLWVFLITGIGHTLLELLAEGSGLRVIEDAYVFSIPVGYPFLPIILGFFEGGYICVGAYHFTRMVANKDKFSTKFFTVLYIVPFIMILIGSINMKIQLELDPSSLTLTRRLIFNPPSIILLTIFYSFALCYFLLNRNIPRKHIITLLYFFIGVILYTSVMNIPTHIAGIRYIEVKKDGSYVPASLVEQFFVLYVLILFLESGFYIQYYAIIYHYKLIEIKKKS